VSDIKVPKMMRALVFSGKGFGDVAVREIPVPEPGPGQALARVDAAGVCTSLLKIIAQGSEHSYFNGWDPAKWPVTLGDEGSVTLVKVGANLRGRWREGQRCVTQPAVDVGPINHRERYRNNAAGMEKTAMGYTLGGHLAQYVLIPEEVFKGECLLPVPDERLPYFACSMAEPISCVVCAQDHHCHYVQESPASPRVGRLGLLKGGVAALVGAGAMGRIHVELAIRARVKALIVSDVVRERLDWVVANLGAKAEAAGVRLRAVGPDETEKAIREESGGRGADDIIMAVGIRPVQQTALGWLARGGVANLFGGLKRGEHHLDLDAIRVHYDGIKVVGSSGGTPYDAAQALELIADGTVDPALHVGMIGSLDQAVEALHLIEQGKSEGKTILYPHIPETPLIPSDGWSAAREKELLRNYGLPTP